MRSIGTALACLSLLLSIPPTGGPSPQRETLRVQVSLVTVGVRVTDDSGRGVPGLRAEDFRLFEDGVRQPIAFFSSEEQPLSLGILLDRSESMGDGNKLSRAQAAAEALIRSGRPDNELLFVPFDHTAKDPPEFTTDRDRIVQDIRATAIGGGTSLYDAILKGLERMTDAGRRKQVLVVITDGADQHSRHTLAEVIRSLEESRVQMYMIGYFTPREDETFRSGGPTISLIDGTPIDNPRVVFDRMAAESGAEAFFPTSEEALREIVEAISADLRTQYTLAYYPPNPTEVDRYRRIRVEVRQKNANVRARRGYILRSDPGASRAKQAAVPEDQPRGGNRRSETPGTGDDRGRAVSRCDDFSDPGSGWPTRAEAFYAGGSYRLKGKDVLVTTRPEMSDFRARLRLEVRSSRIPAMATADPMAGAGLVFRAGPQGFYAVIVYFHPRTSQGYCVATRQDGKGITELARWPAAVLRERPVDLSVVAAGGKFEVSLNRRFLGAFEDDRFSSGGFGMLLAGQGEARFDDYCVEPVSPGAGPGYREPAGESSNKPKDLLPPLIRRDG